MTKLLTLLAGAALALAAQAHDGHGASGAHGHATDLFGFVLLGAAIAGALWFGRRK